MEKYIRNFLTEEQKRKPIFKTDIYLDNDITRQINQLAVKTSNKIKTKTASLKIDPIVPNLTFATDISSKQNKLFLNGVAHNSVPTKTTMKTNDEINNSSKTRKKGIYFKCWSEKTS
ncbi:hypothetical protein [Spiroplasma endosymbiont of Polydrusus formosus]|uniref:hypothetical protein n=1 Tax=Spiroplasma endosymbiont of Polydrusus formosus TaxID=3139326 RepID=UPI0035B5311C